MTLKALIPADKEEVNFLYRNKLPKDLKSKRSVASFAASHDSDYLARLATFNNWSMRGSSFKQIKLSKLNH